MKTLIRVFPIILIAALFYAQIASAEESKECASLHEEPVAVFIYPTDVEIEKMQKENSEDDYNTIVDDNLYYKWHAVEYLKERNFPYCVTENEEHTFMTKNKKKYVMNKECRYWCLILWNGNEEPIWADTAGVFAYESYLKNTD